MNEFYDIKEELRATATNWITLLRTGTIIFLIVVVYNFFYPYEKVDGYVLSETSEFYYIDSVYKIQGIEKDKVKETLFQNQKVNAYYNKKNLGLKRVKVK